MGLLILLGCCLSLMVNMSNGQTATIDYECGGGTTTRLIAYSRDNGTNWLLAYSGYGSSSYSTTKSWSGVDAEFALRLRCRSGTATTTITYDDGNNQTNDTVIELAYSNWQYFYFSSILGGDGADSLQPPCGDAVVSFFGTYSAVLSVDGGENYDALTSGSWSWSINGEHYSSAQLIIAEVEADNIIKVRSFEGYPVIATLYYNDWYYSTANSTVTVDGANDTVDGRYLWEFEPTDSATIGNVSFYEKSAFYYMVDNSSDLALYDWIEADAQWVDYVSNDGGTFNLVFNFSNLVRDVGAGTCSPTPAPTASPTNAPSAPTSNPTTSPTSEPTPSPTRYCELRNEPTNPPTSTPSPIDLTSAPSTDPYASVLSAVSDNVIADLTCTDSSSLHMFSFLGELAKDSVENAVFPGTTDTNFLDALFCRTQESNYYRDLKNFVASYPSVFDYETECEIDYNMRENLAVIFTWFLNFDNLYSNVNPKNTYLVPMYEELLDIIAAFNSSLTADEAQTAIAITYSFEFCTDWGFDWCVSIGYGFAFDFLGNVMYYKTGAQAMTLWSYDFSLLDLAASVSVSYDVTQNINNVAGSSYSVDLAVESATTILNELTGYFTGYDKLNAWGYGISFVLGADSLALSDLDTATCIGFSFSYKLQGISGSLSPSVSFGVSRAYTEEYSDLVAKKGSLESNVCVNEHLFSWARSLSQPAIDIDL